MTNKLSVHTVIGRDVKLLEIWLHNIWRRSGLHGSKLEVNLTLWNPAEELLKYVRYLEGQGAVNYKVYQGTGNFIYDLYTCFHDAYEMSSEEWVVRSGSDQLFSKDWGKICLQHINELESEGNSNKMLNFYTTESWDGLIESFGRPASRHITMPLVWSDKYNPDYNRFDKFCESISWHRRLTNEQYGLMYRHPTKGFMPYCQGASWILKKSLYEQYGPFNKQVNVGGVPPDVALMDTLAWNDVEPVVMHDVFTIHRVRGET